ncbi:MAG: hypothetical protein ACK5TC_04280 [bacterium]|jgi:hypothetical protein
MTLVGKISTVEREAVVKTEINETVETKVRFATQRAGQASTWQHMSKHKIRDTTIFLPWIKTIT